MTITEFFKLLAAKVKAGAQWVWAKLTAWLKPTA